MKIDERKNPNNVSQHLLSIKKLKKKIKNFHNEYKKFKRFVDSHQKRQPTSNTCQKVQQET